MVTQRSQYKITATHHILTPKNHMIGKLSQIYKGLLFSYLRNLKPSGKVKELELTMQKKGAIIKNRSAVMLHLCHRGLS